MDGWMISFTLTPRFWRHRLVYLRLGYGKQRARPFRIHCRTSWKGSMSWIPDKSKIHLKTPILCSIP
jgi:hypothetical protein